MIELRWCAMLLVTRDQRLGRREGSDEAARSQATWSEGGGWGGCVCVVEAPIKYCHATAGMLRSDRRPTPLLLSQIDRRSWDGGDERRGAGQVKRRVYGPGGRGLVVVGGPSPLLLSSFAAVRRSTAAACEPVAFVRVGASLRSPITPRKANTNQTKTNTPDNRRQAEQTRQVERGQPQPPNG